jgi:hypothetical protein
MQQLMGSVRLKAVVISALVQLRTKRKQNNVTEALYVDYWMEESRINDSPLRGNTIHTPIVWWCRSVRCGASAFSE